jgi:hypothetical protein
VPAQEQAVETAAALMNAFAERTGLASGLPAQRYLWTDAFAVCNFLELARGTGQARYRDLALALVDQVHHVLGRHRADASRSGWISGLPEQDGEAHPTSGGLRIGKKLPERGPDEPFDERLEWDRDGQYFHYLTQWMHALDQVSRSTHDPRFNRWGRELAAVAHTAFSHGPGELGRRSMFWKMSADLSRPLVASMGQHDPLSGLVTCIQLEATAARLASPQPGPSLEPAVADFAAMLASTDIRTADPLGLGGLLADACRVAQLMAQGALEGAHLLAALLAAAADGLRLYSRHGDWRQPASERLAFRELGLAIGLAGLDLLRREVERDDRGVFARAGMRNRIQELAMNAGLGSTIISFWLDPRHRQPRAWSDHRDINEVMLASSLLPAGFLVLSAAA